MKFLAILLPLLFNSGCFPNPDSDTLTAEKILQKVSQNLQDHNAVSFNVRHLKKYLYEEDTVATSAQLIQIRVPEDTLFGGYVWLAVDTMICFYDLQTIYTHSLQSNSTTTFKAHQGESFGLRGAPGGYAFYKGFFKPEGLLRSLEGEESVVVTEEKVEGRACWKINVTSPDQGEYYDQIQVLWVDKEEPVIRKNSSHIGYQWSTQYDEWNFSNIRFDEITADELIERNRTMLEANEIIPFVPTTYSEMEGELLTEGNTAPDFVGRDFASDVEVKLSESEAKVILLDFWFSACPGCVSVIEELEEMDKKYGSKGVEIWGVNSVDRGVKGKQRVRNFLKYNRMDYPTILVEPEVDSSYNVTLYPTIYVLNRERKVIYTQLGFQPEMRERLDSIIAAELRREQRSDFRFEKLEEFIVKYLNADE
ncbi:MAG: peroxiredoxin family protein [Candidatus Kapaibacterium sp.]